VARFFVERLVLILFWILRKRYSARKLVEYLRLVAPLAFSLSGRFYTHYLHRLWCIPASVSTPFMLLFMKTLAGSPTPIVST